MMRETWSRDRGEEVGEERWSEEVAQMNFL